MAVSSVRRTIGAALLAGMVGAVTVEVYLFAVGLASWPGTYQWIASAVRGPAAYASASAVWLGVAMHVAVSLGWALAFAVAATTWPRILTRPLLSGLLYGVVVFAMMQGAIALAGIWTAPSPILLLHYLVDHAVFFGLPLALLYRWVSPTASPRGGRRGASSPGSRRGAAARDLSRAA